MHLHTLPHRVLTRPVHVWALDLQHALSSTEYGGGGGGIAGLMQTLKERVVKLECVGAGGRTCEGRDALATSKHTYMNEDWG